MHATKRSTRPAATPFEISGTQDWPAFPFDPARRKERAPRLEALYKAVAGGGVPRIADWQWDRANWNTIYHFLRGKGYSPEELQPMNLEQVRQAVGTIEVSASMHTTDGPMILSLRLEDVPPAIDTTGPELDAERQRVRVDGLWYDVTPKQTDMLAVLFKANGAWTAGKTIDPHGNAHHTRASMKKPVAGLIQSHQDNGYRIPSLLPQ